jgi:hypothetical protein
MRASVAIQRGRDDFRRGVCFSTPPFTSPESPVIVEGFHGATSIGPVRVGLDFRRLWEIGWNIEDLIEVKGSKP